MREIVLDTETTGLDPFQGHRVVEIGCVELLNRIPTGRSFHRYLNPERDMPAEAAEVHGLTAEFLKDKPVFAEIADEFLGFIGDAPLIAHNASFDIAFLNAELERVTKGLISRERIVDTLLLARRKHPGGANRLDDLCARYGIDNTRRTKHGALLDAEILVEVYLELTGGRQRSLSFEDEAEKPARLAAIPLLSIERRTPRISLIQVDEAAAHAEHVKAMGGSAIWMRYREKEAEALRI